MKLTKKEKVFLGIGLGIGLAGLSVAVYYALKYNGIKAAMEVAEAENKMLLANNTQLQSSVNTLTSRVTILEEIVSEDVLEEAIATTTRKYNYRCDKVALYELKDGLDAKAKLEEHKLFRDIFAKRLRDFNEVKAKRYLDK